MWIIDIFLFSVFGFIFLVTIANRILKLTFLFEGLYRVRSTAPVPQLKTATAPAVAIHVAISNENPQIVIPTLKSLSKLNYPDYLIIVISNNTEDESFWKPVEVFCSQNTDKFIFRHVTKIPGYKAGALNYALLETSLRYKFIAIVDADTIISDSNFLSETIPHFNDAKVAIVQTPLGFAKDPRHISITKSIYLIYRYFLHIYMHACNRYRCAPFIGAMGIIRRSALESVDGWNGHYLTEDMELSGRLFQKGFTSYFMDHPYGYSMPPGTFESFKKQHYRWNYGNIQILRDCLLQRRWSEWQHPKGLLSFIYYMGCPGIYLNLYFIPCVMLSILALIIAASGWQLMSIFFCFQMMLGLLIIELFGETMMFFRLGASENASYKDRFFNLSAWWALTLNNCRSTWAAIFFLPRPFLITEKDMTSKTAWNVRNSLELYIVIILPFLTAISLWLIENPLAIVAAVLQITLWFVTSTILLINLRENRQ